MGIDYMVLGRQIKRFRKMQHLSQEELAEKCDISVSHLSYLENGARRASLDTLFEISTVLEVPMDMLLGEHGHNFKNYITSDFEALFGDCSRFEALLLYDVACAAKGSCRAHSRLINNNKK